MTCALFHTDNSLLTSNQIIRLTSNDVGSKSTNGLDLENIIFSSSCLHLSMFKTQVAIVSKKSTYKYRTRIHKNSYGYTHFLNSSYRSSGFFFSLASLSRYYTIYYNVLCNPSHAHISFNQYSGCKLESIQYSRGRGVTLP